MTRLIVFAGFLEAANYGICPIVVSQGNRFLLSFNPAASACSASALRPT
jgi:hypothetical protein